MAADEVRILQQLEDARGGGLLGAYYEALRVVAAFATGAVVVPRQRRRGTKTRGRHQGEHGG
jgi:hypothetical protein